MQSRYNTQAKYIAQNKSKESYAWIYIYKIYTHHLKRCYFRQLISQAWSIVDAVLLLLITLL